MTNFQYKTYRVEWQVQLGEVDQYGNNFKPYQIYSYPTKEEAFDALPLYAREHEWVEGRWVPMFAPHNYCEAMVVYREVEVK